jgi:AAHS family 4-hydroxybenzoate transporter-like MFS transporter
MDRVWNIAETIDTGKLSRFQVTVFILCFLSMLSDGFDMQILPFSAAQIVKDLAIEPSRLGPLVSTGLVGMLLSGFLAGIVADKVGRRGVILTGLCVSGVFTLAKAFTRSYDVFLVLQLLAGLGLGAVVVNVLALTAEYAPARGRRFIVTCVGSAYPLGGIVASYVTATLHARIGWSGIFLLGGGASLVLCVVSAMRLPVSVRQLVLQGKSPARVAQIMRRIRPDIPPDATWFTPDETLQKSPVVELFRAGRGTTTVLLALGSMMSLTAGYFVVVWSPMLFSLAGLVSERAVIAASMLQTGAVLGALLWGRLTDLYWPPAILGTAALICLICFSAVGHVTGNYPLLVGIVFLGGVGMGVQSAYNSFVTSLYPTAMRGTALGTIIGFSRIGGMFGPILAGLLLAAKWSTIELYYVPAGICGIAILCMILLTVLGSSRRFIASIQNPPKADAAELMAGAESNRAHPVVTRTQRI